MKKYFLLLIITAYITGCNKSNNQDPAPDYSDSYLPLNTGGTRSYIHNGDNSERIVSKATGDLHFQDNLMFYGVTYGTGETYYCQSGHSYYMIFSPEFGNDFTVPILDDSEPAGYTSAIFPSTANSLDKEPVETELTIVETGVNIRINGTAYKDVVHTNVEIWHPNRESENPVVYAFYFAKGIGLIEIDKTDDQVLYDILTLAHQQ